MSCINLDTGTPCTAAELTSYDVINPPALYASQSSIEAVTVVVALALAYVSYGVLKALKNGASERERTKARSLVKGGIAVVLVSVLLFIVYNAFIYNLVGDSSWPSSDIFISNICTGCG